MTERLNRLQGRLRDAGLDAFISFSAPANEYLSGFRGSTSALAVTPERAVFLCDFRYTEQAQGQVADFGRQVRRWWVRWKAGWQRCRTPWAYTRRPLIRVLTYYQHQSIQDTYKGGLTPDTIWWPA